MAHVSLLALVTEQTDLPLEIIAPVLDAAHTACLKALRAGATTKRQVALAAGLSPERAQRAQRALGGLALMGLAETRRGWRLTELGRTFKIGIAPDARPRGNGKLGGAALRALDALDRPMSRSDLAGRLGLSRQRAHQLIVQLYAAGRIRHGEREGRLSGFIARTDDRTPLLSRREERLLSAIPERYATTAAKIRQRAKFSESAAARALRRLTDLGLVGAEKAAGPEVYRLTAAGAVHPQCRPDGGRADPPSLPVRSDRVCAVLSLLAECGHLHITEVRDALGIAHQSINALFQYLKRKALVRQDKTGRGAPYTLTAQGYEVLAEMQRRRVA